MTLDRELLQELSNGQSWNRGVNYYRSGRVLEAKIEGSTLKAEVSGSSYPYYQVEIEIEPSFRAYCSCPYDFGGLCKHIIAAGLTLIDEGDALPRAKDEKEKIRIELEELIEDLEREDYLQLLTEMAYRNDWAMGVILDYLEESKGSSSSKVVVKKLDLLQQEALAVIEEFNRYGGGPEEEEELFYDRAYEMIEMLENHEIPAEYRRDLIDKFMPEFLVGNSGLSDATLDIVYTAAQSEEDWLKVIDYLEKSDSSFDRERIMYIYRDRLGEKEKYLELRKKKLEYGTDYYDLACFYRKEGEIERAVEVAREGEEQGAGRIIDNIRFLRKYYQEKGDYQRTLQYYVKEFAKEPSSEKYFAILEFCQEEKEKEEIESKLMEIIKGSGYGRSSTLAAIYEEKEEYDKILELVLQEEITPGRYEEILISEFPGEMVDFYQRQVQKCIDIKKRKSYRRGAQIALKIRKIFSEIFGETEKWQEYYQGILESYTRRPALQDEFKKACDPEY